MRDRLLAEITQLVLRDGSGDDVEGVLHRLRFSLQCDQPLPLSLGGLKTSQHFRLLHHEQLLPLLVQHLARVLVGAYFVGSVEVAGGRVQVGGGRMGCPDEMGTLRGSVFLLPVLMFVLGGVVDGGSLLLYLPG